jgi:YfiH family protein
VSQNWIVPDWPAPENVRAVITTRDGGVSAAPFSSMNCGDHVGDDPAHVTENRRRLAHQCGLSESDIRWLDQVHGTRVISLSSSDKLVVEKADASVTGEPGVACVIMTADCLPVLFCDRQGSMVAAAHAGWRGLADGVLEATLSCFDRPNDVIAFLGPAISQQHFEVGQEVFDAFLAQAPEHGSAFQSLPANGKYLADLYLLAKQKLQSVGIGGVFGGGCCTFAESSRFFSYRREQVTGRMASLIFLDESRQSTAKMSR